MFAPKKSSFTAVPTVSGRPIPPYSGVLMQPIQPPSLIFWYTEWNDAGMITRPFSKRAPTLSPSRFAGSSCSCASLSASSSTISTSARSHWEKASRSRRSSVGSHSKSWNLMSRMSAW